jgi:hypothetical protein
MTDAPSANALSCLGNPGGSLSLGVTFRTTVAGSASGESDLHGAAWPGQGHGSGDVGVVGAAWLEQCDLSRVNEERSTAELHALRKS